MVKSSQHKLNSVSVDNTFKLKLYQLNIDFHEKIIESLNGGKEHNHNSNNPNDKCCNCGFMQGMAELLMTNQARKSEKLE